LLLQIFQRLQLPLKLPLLQ